MNKDLALDRETDSAKPPECGYDSVTFGSNTPEKAPPTEALVENHFMTFDDTSWRNVNISGSDLRDRYLTSGRSK